MSSVDAEARGLLLEGATSLSAGTQNKRVRSHTDSELESPEAKKPKTDGTSKDKKHRKKRKRKVPVVVHASEDNAEESSQTVLVASPTRVKLEEGSTAVATPGNGSGSSTMKPRMRAPSQEGATTAGPSTIRLPSESKDTPQGEEVLDVETGLVSQTTRSPTPVVHRITHATEPQQNNKKFSHKGKGKATQEFTPEPQSSAHPTSGNTTSASSNTMSLSNSADTMLLSQHQEVLGSLSQSLFCQICLDILFKPYALAPCGHVTCYDCLMRWFTAPAENEGHEARPARPTWRRKKTCPHCRGEVTERPGEVWIIKDMVHTLAKSGLVPGFLQPPPAEGQAAPPAPNTTNVDANVPPVIPGPAVAVRQPPAPVDPWDGIFLRPDRYGEEAGEEEQRMGVRDEEDDVWRCYDCMHEIFDGECTGCGRPYPAHFGIGDDDDDDDDDGWGDDLRWLGFGDEAAANPDVLGEMDLDAADVDEYVGHYGPLFVGIRRDERGERPWFAEANQDDEDEDEDDSDSDDDDHGFGVRRRPSHQALDRQWRNPAILDRAGIYYAENEDPQAGRRRAANRERIDDLEEDEERSEDDGSEESQYGGSFIDDGDDAEGAGHPEVHNVIDLADSDHDEEIDARRVGRGYRLHHTVFVESDDDGDVQIIDAPPRRLNGRGRPSAPIILSSDSEHDDEDALSRDEDEEEEEDDENEDIRHVRRERDYYEDGEDDDGYTSQEDQDEEDDDGSIRRPPMRLARNMGRR